MYKNEDYEFLRSYLDVEKPCIVCGSVNLLKFAKQSFLEAKKCKECGMISTNPYFTDEGTSLFYEKYFSLRQTNDPLLEIRNIQYLKDLAFLEKTISSGRILDIGSSAGYFLSKFSNQWEKYGLELTDDCRVEAQNLFGIDVVIGDVVDVDFDCKFDVVSMRGVIEHFIRPTDVFDRLPDFLNDGGYLYICATPTCDNLAFETFRGDWRLFTPFEHVHFFSKDHLARLLGPKFTFIECEFPYLDTPYSNIVEDMKSIDTAINQKVNGKEITAVSRSFPGAMINIIFKYEP